MDLPPRPSDHLPVWERKALQQTIRRFTRGVERIGLHDRDDLDQDLVIHWWRHRDAFSTEGPANARTYMVKVLENRLRDIADEEQAAKRGKGKRDASLDESNDDRRPLHERLPDGDPSSEDQAIRGERDDAVRRWMDSLPERDAATIRAIYVEPTMAAAAERLGIRRHSIYDRLKRLRRLARDAGLERFL